MNNLELIKILRDQSAEIAKADINGWGNTMILAAEAIEGLLESIPSWIKCSERLPEKYTEVMIWPIIDGRILTAQLTTTKSNPTLRWMYSDYVHSHGYEDYDGNVTYWQPLPAPPTQREEG